MAEVLVYYPAACIPFCLLLVAAYDLARLATHARAWKIEVHVLEVP